MSTVYEYESPFRKDDPVYIMRFFQHNSHGRVHWHEAIEILYFTQGKAVCGCNLKEYSLGKGEFILMNGNELHTAIISQVNSAHYMFQFDPALVHNLIGNEFLLFENAIHDEKCAAILDALIKAYYEEKGYKRIIKIKTLTLELFSLLTEFHVQKVLDEESYKKQFKRLDLYNRIIKYLSRNFNQDLDINILARQFSLSPSYFSHLFKQYAQKSVIEYLNELRISRAKQFLEKEESSIGEIATRVGFYDLNYFSRKFKAIVGITPTEYRKIFI